MYDVETVKLYLVHMKPIYFIRTEAWVEIERVALDDQTKQRLFHVDVMVFINQQVAFLERASLPGSEKHSLNIAQAQSVSTCDT